MGHFYEEIYGLRFVFLSILWPEFRQHYAQLENSKSTVKRRREKWGFLGTRQQAQTLDSIHPYIQAIREKFPFRGSQKICAQLFLDYNIKASR